MSGCGLKDDCPLYKRDAAYAGKGIVDGGFTHSFCDSTPDTLLEKGDICPLYDGIQHILKSTFTILNAGVDALDDLEDALDGTFGGLLDQLDQAFEEGKEDKD